MLHSKFKAQFWERLELSDFPFDLQELNVILTSKLDSSQINLVADTDNFSIMNPDTHYTFLDQQKWFFFLNKFFIFLTQYIYI